MTGAARHDLNRVEAALAAAIHDVEATTPYRWATRVGAYDDWASDDPRARVTHDPSAAAVHIEGDDFVESFRVFLGADAEIRVHVASTIQDTVTHGLRAAWPKCPRHDHPLEATVLHGQSVWVCPRDGSFVAEIGALSGAS